jgi:osmotically-inducible protein OsmY
MKHQYVLRIAASFLWAGAIFSQTPPDNTKVNKGEAVTADQQKMNPEDRKIAQDIRKSVMADKSLSTYAHNVKIIAMNGTVTLKGPVRSDEEKKTIVAKAAEVVGSPDKVTDQLTVKSSSPDK